MCLMWHCHVLYFSVFLPYHFFTWKGRWLFTSYFPLDGCSFFSLPVSQGYLNKILVILTDVRDVVWKTVTTKSCISFIYEMMTQQCFTQAAASWPSEQVKGRFCAFDTNSVFFFFNFLLNSLLKLCHGFDANDANDGTICITLIPQTCLGRAYAVL